MKKQGKQKSDLILHNLDTERYERRLKSKEKKKDRNRGKSHKQKKYIDKQKGPSNVGRREIVPLPKVLDLDSNYDKTVEVLRYVKERTLHDRAPILLNFDETVSISPSAALYLVSEVYRCRNIDAKAGRLTGTYPKNRDLERFLQDMGFFEILAVSNRLPKNVEKKEVEYIKFQTGIGAIGSQASLLEDALLGRAAPLKGPASRDLYRGLTEAMSNVINHAYMDIGTHRYPHLTHRWWMLGHIDRTSEHLTVLFHDQGVGIPRTLPLRFGEEIIKQALARLSLISPRDGEIIRAAMEIGRTRTGESHRGRGLNDLRRFIDVSADGFLEIFSNRGRYKYMSNGNEETKNSLRSIGGTLIQWTVHLPSVIT